MIRALFLSALTMLKHRYELYDRYYLSEATLLCQYWSYVLEPLSFPSIYLLSYCSNAHLKFRSKHPDTLTYHFSSPKYEKT